MAFGQEFGRALSDGRIVGRAEPFAKVFPSSRAVKRAVGLVAWAILEDIALDARIDDAGRLVSEANVRRIAANLGISKNTVTQHLATLREYSFVLREEVRDEASGRYELTRYVLDPSACIERFTVTPSAHNAGPSDRPGSGPAGAPPSPAAQGGAADPPRPKAQDTDVATPRPKDWGPVPRERSSPMNDMNDHEPILVSIERDALSRGTALEAELQRRPIVDYARVVGIYGR
jgi:DNA-binding transcriptional ArsR family regulator